MKGLLRWMLLVLVAALALELFFVVRIASMAAIDPQSSAFQRSIASLRPPSERSSTPGAVRKK